MPGKHPITGANWDDVFDMASRSGLEAVGLLLEERAARLAARKTGRLAGSITHATVDGVSPTRSPADRADGVSKPRSRHEVWIGTNVKYAPHIEFGTKYTPGGQPFLRPALDNNRKAVVRLYAEQLDKVIKRGKF